MAGYTLLAEEAWEAGLAACPPTHVFLQCGVGGLSSGVAAGLWRRMAPRVPRVVTVEPVAAACMLASLRAGRPAAVDGDLRSRMAGLACGRLSLPSWDILSRAAFAALTVDEETAESVQHAIEGRCPWRCSAGHRRHRYRRHCRPCRRGDERWRPGEAGPGRHQPSVRRQQRRAVSVSRRAIFSGKSTRRSLS